MERSGRRTNEERRLRHRTREPVQREAEGRQPVRDGHAEGNLQWQRSDDPYFGLTWAVVSEDGTLHEAATDSVLPKDMVSVGNVPSGVSGVGNVAFEVSKEDVNSLVLYIEGETASFDNEGAYLALD